MEEIETSQEDTTKEETGPQKKIDNNFNFITQETIDHYFFIFNILNYDKEGIKIALFEEEVLLSYEDKEKELRAWIKLLKSYNKEESEINLVKDYVVIKLKKSQEEYWESNGWKKLGKDLLL